MSLVEEFFKQYDELADKYEKYTDKTLFFYYSQQSGSLA